ncbi:MAG: hypothetical protein WA227_23105, partial [Mycobacterium sp.]
RQPGLTVSVGHRQLIEDCGDITDRRGDRAGYRAEGSTKTAGMQVAIKKSAATPTMTAMIRRRRARAQLCHCSMTSWVFAGVAR